MSKITELRQRQAALRLQLEALRIQSIRAKLAQMTIAGEPVCKSVHMAMEKIASFPVMDWARRDDLLLFLETALELEEV